MIVTNTRRRFSKTSSITICVLVLIKEPDEICYGRYIGVSEENSFFESIPKIFDYSLRGYYHRERWARTRRYYQKSYYLMIKGATNYSSLYSKNMFFDYSLGGYSHRERWSRTRQNFYMHERVKKAKEDLESAITTIGREYILN
jgi:hypothetical protein